MANIYVLQTKQQKGRYYVGTYTTREKKNCHNVFIDIIQNTIIFEYNYLQPTSINKRKRILLPGGYFSSLEFKGGVCYHHIKCKCSCMKTMLSSLVRTQGALAIWPIDCSLQSLAIVEHQLPTLDLRCSGVGSRSGLRSTSRDPPSPPPGPELSL